MARDRRAMLFALARVWAYPLWCSVTRSESADAVAEDVDWWVRYIGDAELLGLDRYSRFAYLSGALTEFRTLIALPGCAPPRWRFVCCCGQLRYSSPAKCLPASDMEP